MFQAIVMVYVNVYPPGTTTEGGDRYQYIVLVGLTWTGWSVA